MDSIHKHFLAYTSTNTLYSQMYIHAFVDERKQRAYIHAGERKRERQLLASMYIWRWLAYLRVPVCARGLHIIYTVFSLFIHITSYIHMHEHRTHTGVSIHTDTCSHTQTRLGVYIERVP